MMMDETLTRLPQSPEVEKEINCNDLTQTEQRSLIFHLLYAIDAYDYDISIEAIADNFRRGYGIHIPKESPVFRTAAAIVAEHEKLDTLIIPLIDNWRFERLGIVTKLILRQSIWEFLHIQTEPAVIINEAVELAKCFAEKDAYKFINGLLDEYVSRQTGQERF